MGLNNGNPGIDGEGIVQNDDIIRQLNERAARAGRASQEGDPLQGSRQKAGGKQPPPASTPVAPEVPDDLIPATKAAQLLQLHVANLHRWRTQGRLRAWLRGRQWFFSRAEVLSQFQEQRPYKPSGPNARERRAEQQWLEETLRKHGLGAKR